MRTVATTMQEDADRRTYHMDVPVHSSVHLRGLPQALY